jgi:integrase
VPEAIALLKDQQMGVVAHAKKLAQPPSPFVFPGYGASGHLASPKAAWKRVLDRAKINDLRIHDLRRSLGSWQARTGASLTIVGKTLGHKSPQSTAIYARLDLDPVRQSVETATSAMLVAAGLKSAANVTNIDERRGAPRRRRPSRSR